MKRFIVGICFIVSTVWSIDRIVESNFYDTVSRVYHPSGTNVFIGRDLEIIGIWFPGIYAGQPMVGRYVLWCCAIDPYVVGFLIQTSQTNFKKETWVKIVGTVKEIETPGGKIPAIICRSIEKIPDEYPYVLPPSAVPMTKPKEQIPGI